MNRLVDVDVDGVHLVGEPANKRRFAIVKGLTGPTLQGDPIVKTADLKKKIDALKDAEIAPDAFVKLVGVEFLAKALDLEVVDGNLDLEKAAADKAAAKKKADEDAAKLDKSKLDDKTRAYVEGLEKKITDQGGVLDGIVKDREATVTADLAKRVGVLKERGFAPEGDKPAEVEIRALEKAAEKYATHLKDIGVLDIKGSNDEPAGSAREAVAKAVREQLGREPVDAIEEATTRSKIYRANPGLLKSVLHEERQSA